MRDPEARVLEGWGKWKKNNCCQARVLPSPQRLTRAGVTTCIALGSLAMQGPQAQPWRPVLVMVIVVVLLLVHYYH
jgi:hypothetical protein